MIPPKAFVVVDIPGPCKTSIQLVRDRLKTVTAKLPVEITLAGSSGVGPIPEGTDLGLIRDEVGLIASAAAAFRMEFAEIGHFPGTGVFFLSPKERAPFDALHAALAASRIPFVPSPFPYRPHCTLRVGPPVAPDIAESIYAIPLPRDEMLLDSISVYAVDARTLTVRLLHRATLGK